MKNLKLNTILLILIFVITVLGYFYLVKFGYLDFLIEWGKQNLLLYFVLLVLIKILGVVWPPIPGGMLSLGSIPVIGWELAFLADFTGGLIGSLIAYMLGYNYGRVVLKYVFHDKAEEYLNKIQLNKNRELELVLVTRVTFNFISEFISYLSGVLKIKFHNFIMGVMFSHLIAIPAFYFTSEIYKGRNLYLSILFFVILIFLLYKFRNRYLE